MTISAGVFIYDAIKGDDGSDSQSTVISSEYNGAGDGTDSLGAAPSNPASEGNSSGDSTPAELGAVEAAVQDKDFGSVVDGSVMPEELKQVADTCAAMDIVPSYFEFGSGSGIAKGRGLNCVPRADYRGDFEFIQYIDNADAIRATKDGQASTPEVNLPLDSTRGSTFRAQKVGDDNLSVSEILPGDKGVVLYFTSSQDPKKVESAFQKAGVAK